MLTGESNNRITIRDYDRSNGGNKVSIIKAIREVTGLGLKDAKDQADILMGQQNGWSPSRSITIDIAHDRKHSECVTLLRNAGCTI